MIVVSAASTFMIVVMIMMMAGSIRVEGQLSGEEGLHRCICTAGDTVEQADPHHGKGALCASADPAADESICFQLGQHAGQRTMALSVGAVNSTVLHFSVC